MPEEQPQEPRSRAPFAASENPPPARVPGNRWSAIAVPEIGAQSPRAELSVLVSGRDPDGLLALTLASLAAQSYPRELVEVLVAPQTVGSAEELAALAPAGLEVRSGGAAEARGEILVLVDAGALCEPALLAAHARWHEAVADAVSVAQPRRAELSGLGPAEVREAARAGTLAALLSGRARPDAPERALCDYLELTHSLEERRDDLFWVASHGQIGLRSETLARAGEPAAPGDERRRRLDLAWRLEASGVVFVAEPAAASHHHYESLASPPGTHDPLSDSLVPARGFRAPGAARGRRRPAVCVTLRAREQPLEELLALSDAVLGGRLRDLELHLSLPAEHRGRELLAAALSDDPRVTLSEDPTGGRPDAALQIALPAIAAPDERTLADLQALIAEERVGALHVTVPGVVPHEAMLEVAATGPLARARRVAAHEGASPDTVLGELFGERWISGVEVSLRRRGDAEPQVTEHGPLAAATDLTHERTQRVRHMARAEAVRRRADRLAARAESDRRRAAHERTRAEQLAARIAASPPPPWYWRPLPLERLVRTARSRLRRG